MDYFKFLPLEIILDILSRLPTEVVLECKLVCTNWRSAVRHQSFSKMHFNRLSNSDSGKLGFIVWSEFEKNRYIYTKSQYFEFNQNHDESKAPPIDRIREIDLASPFVETNFIGSCNGLICFSRKCYGIVYICNPITREHVSLPRIKSGSDMYVHLRRAIGFGYVSSTDEYKVVGLYSLKPEFIEVHIYTLGSGNGWRNLGKFSFEFYSCECEKVLFANGALYWVDIHTQMIVTFDLAEEKFRQPIAPPPLPPDEDLNGGSHVIGVLDGFLFFAVSQVVEGAKCYQIWLLNPTNEYHDMKDKEKHLSWVWSKEFRFVSVENCKLLAVVKGDCVLTSSRQQRSGTLSLRIYDTKASTSKRIVEFKEPIREVFPHKNTLVSLKELGEVNTKTMKSVKGD